MKTTKEDQKEAIAALMPLLKKGKFNVYTAVEHVSSSGMSRVISCYVSDRAGHIQDITYWVGKVTGYKIHSKYSGLNIGGCGMDMGFHLVYSLSRCLFPNGFKLEKGQYGRNGDKSGFDKDGGYKLKQIWL